MPTPAVPALPTANTWSAIPAPAASVSPTNVGPSTVPTLNSTGSTGPGGKVTPVITPAPAVKNYNQTLSKVNTLQQQAQAKSQQPVVGPNGQIQVNGQPVGQTAQAQQPPTAPPTQTPSTGNANTDQAIAGVNGVTVPQAPTNLTDSFGNPLTVPAGLTGADETNYVQQYNQNQQQYQGALGQISTLLGQIASGTYYTPAQQNQIASTQQLFQNTATLLDSANQASTRADITLGLRSGESMATIANQAKDETMQLAFQLSNNTAKMTQTVANLQEAFEKDNLDAVQAESDNLTKAYTAQTDYINKMITTAQDAQDKVNTYNLQLAKDVSDAQDKQFTDSMASATLSLSQKKDAFDMYMQQANLSEKEKTDAQTAWYQQQDIALKGATLKLDEQKQAFTEGLTNYGSVQQAAAQIPGVVTDNTLGITYFDSSQFPDKTQAQAFENAARNNGIAIPNDPADVKTIQAITNATSSLTDFKNSFQELFKPPTKGITGAEEGLEQQNRIVQFNAMRDTIGGILKSVDPNSAAAGYLKTAQDTLPSFGFGSKVQEEVNPGYAQTQLNVVQQNLTNALTSILPGIQYTSVNSYISSNPIDGPKLMQKFQAQYPGATPDDFLQVINTNQ